MANAEGVGVYNGDGDIYWHAVLGAGKSFGIVKVTEGVTLIDHHLQRNMDSMKQLNMVRGCYHFFRFDSDPFQQANRFLNAAYGAGYDSDKGIPLVADIEDRKGANKLTQPQIWNKVGAFLHTVEQRMGRFAVIYCDLGFANTYLGDGFGGASFVACLSGTRYDQVTRWMGKVGILAILKLRKCIWDKCSKC